MLKIIDYAAGPDLGQSQTALVKVSSRGLIGADLADFSKRAGTGLLAKLDDIEIHPGEALLHLYAMGATEKFGSNRNGDGFKEAMLRHCHPTFVSHARFYRNHKNTDRSKSYGVVKASNYRDDIGCVELIAAINGSKEAADRNGGLIADIEMEKLARGEDIPVSMAIKVPYDICSWCGNHARSRAEYCTASECDAGGLRTKMGRVVQVGNQFHHLHADNPNGTFFDITHVYPGRQADRIAYVTGLLKHAADLSMVVSGAELAEAVGLDVPPELRVPSLPPGQLRKLADCVAIAASTEASFRGLSVMQDTCNLPALPGGRDKLAHALRALTDANILLPLTGFIQLHAGLNVEKSAAVATKTRPALAGIFGALRDDEFLVDRLEKCDYWPGAHAAPEYVKWAGQLKKFAMEERQLFTRLAHLQPIEKAAAATVSEAEMELAFQFALYKIAFLASRNTDSELTLRAAVIQN